MASQTFSTTGSSSLAEVLDSTRREERRQALRALLLRPTLFVVADAGASGNRVAGAKEAQFIQDSFVLVRRHAEYLSRWLARYTGWTLILRSDSARLAKQISGESDGTRGAIDPGSSAAPLSRSRYVLWCLLMVVLHDEGRQTTLHRLAESAVRLAETMPELTQRGVSYDLKTATTRRSLVCVIRLAIRHGILLRIGGDEERYGASETTDCLYNIHRGLLADLFLLPGGQPAADADESLRPRDLEHHLMRRLLDNPVLYFEELTEREYQYFQSQRARLFDVIEQATGLVPELRSEGIAMLDPSGDLTDLKMPDAGTIGHATLLLGEFLTTKLSAQTGQGLQSVSRETLLTHLRVLAEQNLRYWKKGITQAGALDALLNDCLDRLEGLRMIRRAAGEIVPLPAVARFVADDVRQEAVS